MYAVVVVAQVVMVVWEKYTVFDCLYKWLSRSSITVP